MTIGWHFDNTYSKLSNTFKENIKPTPVHDPELVILNEELASTLNKTVSELPSILKSTSAPASLNTVVVPKLNLSDPHTAENVQKISEIMQIAYSLRSIYMADSDFYKVPEKEFLSKEKAKELLENINLEISSKGIRRSFKCIGKN